MKRALLILALCGSVRAGDQPKFESYVEMQAKREAIADAKYARFRAEQDAVIKEQKQKAQGRALYREQIRADRARYLQLMNIAAAGAPKVNVNIRPEAFK
jgi:hypothetical protein